VIAALGEADAYDSLKIVVLSRDEFSTGILGGFQPVLTEVATETAIPVANPAAPRAFLRGRAN
jgi:hypothetical protein